MDETRVSCTGDSHIGCLKLQVSFRKTATHHWALVRKLKEKRVVYGIVRDCHTSAGDDTGHKCDVTLHIHI